MLTLKSFCNTYKLISNYNYKILIITILLVVISLFEYFSLVSLIPTLHLIFNPDSFEKILYKYNLNKYFEIFGFHKKDLFIILISLTTLIFFIKTLTTYLYFYIRNFFLKKICLDLSVRLFTTYVKNNIIFYKSKKTSELINSIIEVEGFVFILVLSFINLVNDLLIFFFIIILLFQFDYIITLVSLFLFLFLFIIFFFFFKKKFYFIGKEKFHSNTEKMRILQETFSSIKEIKVFNLENKVLESFSKYNLNFLNNFAKEDFLKSLPRPFFELTIIFVFCTFVLFNNLIPEKDILLKISFFAIASFRLIPCLSKIVADTNNIRSKLYYTEKLRNYFDIEKKINLNLTGNSHNPNQINFKKIKFNNVSFKFVDDERYVLSNINLEFNRNETIGIIGPSGSGKTTLVDLLIGLLTPTSGVITVDNLNLRDIQNIEWINTISYVPQNIFLYNENILSNITLQNNLKNINQDILNESLTISNLNNFVNQQPKKILTELGDNASKMSGGEKQRIGIARALYKKSKLLILDEATNALDKDMENKVINSIYNLKKKLTIVIISHSIDNLNKCDRIFEIKNGTISELVFNKG